MQRNICRLLKSIGNKLLTRGLHACTIPKLIVNKKNYISTFLLLNRAENSSKFLTRTDSCVLNGGVTGAQESLDHDLENEPHEGSAVKAPAVTNKMVSK